MKIFNYILISIISATLSLTLQAQGGEKNIWGSEYTNGIAAIVNKEIITIEQLRSRVKPIIPRIRENTNTKADFERELETISYEILNNLIDRVLIVDVSEDTQIQRTLLRDCSNESEIRAIMNSQISRDLRKKAADDIINNDNITLAELKDNVALLHQRYLKQCKVAKK